MKILIVLAILMLTGCDVDIRKQYLICDAHKNSYHKETIGNKKYCYKFLNNIGSNISILCSDYEIEMSKSCNQVFSGK